MEDKIQLYTSSQEEAKKYDEVDLWRESYKENVRCARAIEEATRDNFDGKTLRQNCAESIIEEFGFARVNFVLANTLREKNWDIRFSEDNFQCAKSIYVPREDTSWMFAVESLPAVVNGFCDQVRKANNNVDRLRYMADALHLPMTEAENYNFVKEALWEGKIVIQLMNGKSLFTKSQHFILLKGFNEDGRIMVYDNSKTNRTSWRLDPGCEEGYYNDEICWGY